MAEPVGWWVTQAANLLLVAPGLRRAAVRAAVADGHMTDDEETHLAEVETEVDAHRR